MLRQRPAVKEAIWPQAQLGVLSEYPGDPGSGFPGPDHHGGLGQPPAPTGSGQCAERGGPHGHQQADGQQYQEPCPPAGQPRQHEEQRQ